MNSGAAVWRRRDHETVHGALGDQGSESTREGGFGRSDMERDMERDAETTVRSLHGARTKGGWEGLANHIRSARPGVVLHGALPY